MCSGLNTNNVQISEKKKERKKNKTKRKSLYA